jgi:hypothetical protein
MVPVRELRLPACSGQGLTQVRGILKLDTKVSRPTFPAGAAERWGKETGMVDPNRR